MNSSFKQICELLFVILFISCSTSELLSDQLGWKGDVNDSVRLIGASNAVKKAYQMANIVFYPQNDILINGGRYSKGGRYEGMIYSSAKEINTYVGEDVSFHTFMTAVNNSKSKLYTEQINKSPYHGVNCSAYYGTVCSGLINYALGIKENFRSYDFAISEKMYTVPDANADSVMVADVIWQSGHVALVTQVLKDAQERTINVEITEAVQTGTHRKVLSAETINGYLSGTKRLLRCRDLAQNTDYIPQTNFVAVEGEVLQNYQYNDDLCPDKGDKSCYRTDETVILNTSKAGISVEIYKDEMLINVQNSDTHGDIVLEKNEKGDYKARIVTDGYNNAFIYWKVLDVNVRIDKSRNRVYFSSSNSKPVYCEFCDIAGFRPENYKKIYTHQFTNEELLQGFIEVGPPSATPDNKGRIYSYVKVHFECEFGRVINKPLDWFGEISIR